MVRWGLLSVVSFVGNLGLTILFREVLGAPAPLAFGVALVVVFVVNFLGLRHWVFDIADGPISTQAGRFGLLTLVFRTAEWGVFSLLHVLGAADYRVLVIAVLAASSGIKFFIYRVALRPDQPRSASLEA